MIFNDPEPGEARGTICVLRGDWRGPVAGIVAGAVEKGHTGRTRWRVLIDQGGLSGRPDETVVYADETLVIDEDRITKLYELLREDRHG
jgi:hypothetical protein